MRAEYAAFKARMEESPILAGKVFSVVRRDKGALVRANYVVAMTSAADEIHADSFTYVSTATADTLYTWDVRVVAVDHDGLNLLTEAVLGQLVGYRLVVAGRACSPIVHVPNVERNDGFDMTAELFFRSISMRFWSHPAA